MFFSFLRIMGIKVNVKPLTDNVLIRPLEAETKTASGILLPDAVREKPQIGEVMAVGPGLITPEGKKIPIFVKTKDKVLYKKWGGEEVKMNNEEWVIVKQGDILAIVE